MAVKDIGKSLLVPIFKSLHPDVKKIGYSMGAAALGSVRWQQLAPEQQTAEAALALFQKPPVRQMEDGSCYDADLRVTRETE